MDIQKRIIYKNLKDDINNMTYKQQVILIQFLLKKMKGISIEHSIDEQKVHTFIFDLGQFKGENLKTIRNLVAKYT